MQGKVKMFDISECKKLAKKQLKGNYKVMFFAALICTFIYLILDTTETQLFFNMSFIRIPFSIVKYCITAILVIAYYYANIKLAKTGTVSFSDFTSGLTLRKSAILGSLWRNLFLFVWGLIFIVPIFFICVTIFSSALVDFGSTVKFTIENFPYQDFIQFLKNTIVNYIALLIILAIAFLGLFILMLIKSIQYSQMIMILAESGLEGKNVSVKKAMDLSIELTKGRKAKIFGFYLSFIGIMIVAFIPGIIVSIIANQISDSEILNVVANVITIFCATFIVPYITTAFVNVYGHLKQHSINTGNLTIEDFQ